MPVAEVGASEINDFIARWAASSGAERANFPGFIYELCDLLGVGRPEPANESSNLDNYRFECPVKFKQADGGTSDGRIDLYKRGAFVMEAKQSREKGRPKELKMAGQPDLFSPDYNPRGQRGANRAWDQLMINARHQAQDYARALPVAHGWPPFVIVCDVGHCIEVYADFSGQGKNYAQFPDRQSFRVFLSDLKDEKVRERLKLIWENPTALDPARQSAEVTRDISKRLADVSKRLEDRGHNAEDVALFLMRCLFTMFAEDVELLPKDSFRDLLERCKAEPSKFPHLVEQLWKAMDKGEFAFAIEQNVKKFNGKLFKSANALPLEREDIGELHAAAKRDWRKVEPAIFGTLLEQALNPKERAKLGAHYTPRAYVERLVFVTVIEPLRHEWSKVQATAERFKIESDQLEKDAKEAGTKSKMTASGRSVAAEKAREADAKHEEAIAVLKDFHNRLCQTRVLDPACGTGNFLYVSLKLMKQLEGEILEAISDLAGPQDDLTWLSRQTVDPHQFLGLELNTRAAAIAELVIWLGYLQWHFRTKGEAPPEPILHDFQNINFGKPGGYDAVMTWDGYPTPHVEVENGQRIETYPNARRPEWPQAEFIVGNPPFIGGKDIRANLGDAYTEALWGVHKDINDSADFVMYWWDRAASELTRAKSPLQRFGFVTTNSITQTFSRRVVARHLEAKKPVSILMAIPDHPWTKATDKAAAVRIAMTVAVPGRADGVLREVTREAKLDTDQPEIEFEVSEGRINSDLSLGVDVTSAEPLRANEGLSSPGVKLHGSGFIVTPAEAEALGLRKRAGLDKHIRPYRNGRDLMATPRGVMVIDLFGLEADDVRKRFPEVYQHLSETVRAAREEQHSKSPTRDAKEYLDRWWTHGKPREQLRPALAGLTRFIATVETAKHRTFQLLDEAILPDNMLIAIGSDDAFTLGVLSSRIHVIWALRAGGWLGVGNDPRYSKSRCFDPFPFPECNDDLQARIRKVAEELDAHRKERQTEYPRLTLTQMYNVLEKLKAGEALEREDERIKTEGLVLILKELHDNLDALVFEAYGWPASLTDEEILERLVTLNKKRSLEEKVGNIKWLRPDYQIPRFGSDAQRARLEEERRAARDTDKLRPRQGALELEDDLQEMMPADASKPKFPTGKELEETAAVMGVLATAGGPKSIADIARTFSQGKQIEKRVELTVMALGRLGHLATGDDGHTFTLRRVA